MHEGPVPGVLNSRYLQNEARAVEDAITACAPSAVRCASGTRSQTFSAWMATVGGAQRLAAKARIDEAIVDIFLNGCIENGIGELVRDLVGLAFRNGIASKQIRRAYQQPFRSAR